MWRTSKIIIILSYIFPDPFIGWIISFIADWKAKEDIEKFHAEQAFYFNLIFFILGIILGIVLSIISYSLAIFTVLSLKILKIILGVEASYRLYRGEIWSIPGINKLLGGLR